MIRSRIEWIQSLKLKAIAWLAAIVLASITTIAIAGMPWVPVVGVALAAAAVSVSKLTLRLAGPVCLSCGHDLASEPASDQGIACPACGSIRSAGLLELRGRANPEDPQDDAAA
ncbi:MAG: hypothetical protein KF869_12285 [Phycisphaeraceae bacterium]|nr:hypothetical protein [Phycisphaeraceae bacterium]